MAFLKQCYKEQVTHIRSHLLLRRMSSFPASLEQTAVSLLFVFTWMQNLVFFNQDLCLYVLVRLLASYQSLPVGS